ncbi:hypothetical protein KSP40_PGU006744 [Platanthera guangdongensis]|uniref:Uncharacterized protein n=1 Tax=Platanthera guangdongensis TaxID=2320717 RepID=A0ABR2LYZ2_9ASPA
MKLKRYRGNLVASEILQSLALSDRLASSLLTAASSHLTTDVDADADLRVLASDHCR